MPPTRIMLVRHAEKPEKDDEGVGSEGRHDSRDLVVRGWQRAGALARFFAPVEGRWRHAGIEPPRRIFAASGAGGRSKRSHETATPLADLVRIDIDDAYSTGDEGALAATIMSGEGPVLVVWEHKAIAAIVDRLTGGAVKAPAWPDDRFDMVLVLDRRGEGWRLTQVPQLLLAGDSATPFA
jgi:broad specificity phosphatase PhoE